MFEGEDRKMRKVKTVIAGLVLFACVLCGCDTSKTMSFTFTVGTGDVIKVTLDTSDGFLLSQADSGYVVTKDGDNILQAVFVDQESYQQYMDAVTTQEGVMINRQGSENGITFTSYSYNGKAGMENNFIIWIDGTDTGVVAGSLADLQTATRAFQSLSFTKQ